MRRLATVAGTLGAGACLTAALYWGLLNTPESNLLTLAASAFLALATVAAAALTLNTAVLVARGRSLAGALAAAPRGLGWFVVAVVPLALAWAAIGAFDQWVTAHQGEIQAWFIARFGWGDISPLFRAEVWASRWLRWAVLPAAGLSLLALLTDREARGHRSLRRVFGWRALLIATVVFVFFWALPWQLTAWRPELPPTWIEPAVAALRLGVVFLLGVAGAAVMTVAAVRDR